MGEGTGFQKRVEYYVTNGRGYVRNIPHIIDLLQNLESKLQTTLYYMDVADGKQKLISSQDLINVIGKFEKSQGRDYMNHF